MNASGPLKTIFLLFVGVLGFYLIAYHFIEQRRVRKGPWIVSFASGPSGNVVLRIDQLALGITNVQLALPSQSVPPAFPPKTIRFEKPLPVPFSLPLGECIFMDTTFLPGAVVLKVAGHEVQLIPRVLTIDGREQPWRSDEVILISAIRTNSVSETTGR